MKGDRMETRSLSHLGEQGELGRGRSYANVLEQSHARWAKALPTQEGWMTARVTQRLAFSRED